MHAITRDIISIAGVRDLLERWPTPTALKAAGQAKIYACIAKRSPQAVKRLTKDIYAALEGQTIAATAEAVWGEAIADLASELNRIQWRRDALFNEIQKPAPITKENDLKARSTQPQ